MDSIDSFINLPLIIAAAAALVLVCLLVIIKIRNTAKASFIFYLILGVCLAGVIYTYLNPHIIYLAITLVLSELLILPYVIILACGTPQEKQRKNGKTEEAAQVQVSEETAADSKQLARCKKVIEINRDFIKKSSDMFKQEDSLTKFLDYYNSRLIAETHADGCAILLADEFDNILAVKSSSGTFPPPYKLPEDLPHKPIRIETNFRYAQFPLSGNIFGDVASKGEAVLITDGAKDQRIVQNGPEDFLKCGSYIFVPIIQQDTIIGVASLSRLPQKDKFSKDDLDTACILTEAASTALKPLYSFMEFAEHTELTKEGDIASKFQKELMPARLPVIEKLSIGCYSTPVENVCGDYYDVIASRKDRISFIMADVAGKGMNSLVIMIMIRAMLRLIVNTAQSASTLISWANRGICTESSKIDHFASIALINYDSTKNSAQIATCGINPVLLYSVKTGTVNKISTTSEPVGVDKNTVYKDIDIKLNAGDILITCTDGLLESLNEFGIQYSLTNLSKVVKDNHQLSGKEIANRVRDDIKKYCGTAQQYDDQSLLVVKIQG